MLKAFWLILQAFWQVLKIPLYILIAAVLLFLLMCLFWRFYFYCKGYRQPKDPDSHVPLKKHGLFRSLFVDVPRQYTLDRYNQVPGSFPYKGCVVFTGRQGYGKTISAIQFTREMQQEYPKCKVITNCEYAYQDDVLDTWQPLVKYKNGIYGVVAVIDEMQNWFSSNASQNFPPKMLEVITQNRKNRRIILGTAQCFQRLAKPLREQVTEIRECYTFLGCFTVVIRKEPFLKTDGEIDKLKYRGFYYFVHDEYLRNAYDTYKAIEALSKHGFKEETNITINSRFAVDSAKK